MCLDFVLSIVIMEMDVFLLKSGMHSKWKSLEKIVRVTAILSSWIQRKNQYFTELYNL